MINRVWENRVLCMKFLIAFFICFHIFSLTVSEAQSLNIRTCGFVSSSQSLMNGELSDYWAQELIGSDLLREELEKVPAPEKEIFIFDTLGNNHDLQVKNFISDEGPHAILPELGDKIAIFRTHKSEEYLNLADRFKEKPPSFINNALSWEGDPNIYSAFQFFSPSSHTILSSGNFFPDDLGSMLSRASKNLHAVIVGSFSPKGFVSDFSQEGEEIDILAPSDIYLSSFVAGEYRPFGGTSGAAPLVTGSLAGFEWLSGYHPEGPDIKILLKKTAIPTVHSHEEPRRNGVGLVNTYKLGRLGRRLKEKCAIQDSACIKKEIKNDANYLFPVDKTLKEDLARVFPSCFLRDKERKTENEKVSCDEKSKGFKRLRRAVLLSPGQQDLWESLSCIYREADFLANAEMLNRIALSIGSKEELIHALSPLLEKKPIDLNIIRVVSGLLKSSGDIKILENLLDRNKKSLGIRRTVAIVAGNMGLRGMRLLDILIKDEDPEVKANVAIAAGNIGGSKGFAMLDIFIKDEDPKVRASVAKAAGKIGGSKGFEMLDILIEDEDPEVKGSVAIAAGNIGGSKGFAMLDILIEDEDPEVRANVASAAEIIRGPKGIEILTRLARDNEDPEVKRAVAIIAGNIGGPKGIDILKILMEDENPEVKANVATSAGNIGGPEGIGILEILVKDNKDLIVRDHIALAVRNIGGSEGIDILEILAEDEHATVKATVAVSVGNMGARAIDILESVSKYSDSVAKAQVTSLERYIGLRAVRILENLSEDESPSVRRQAAYELKRIKGF